MCAAGQTDFTVGHNLLGTTRSLQRAAGLKTLRSNQIPLLARRKIRGRGRGGFGGYSNEDGSSSNYGPGLW